MSNNNSNPNLFAAVVVFACILIWSIYQLGKMAISDIQYNRAKAKVAQSESYQTQSQPANTSGTNYNPPSSTPSRIDPVLADDFEKLVVNNGRPIVFAASVEGDNGPAVSKSDSKFLAIWVTKEWDYLTDIDKRTFVKLHLSVFNQWRGKDDGIVIVFDPSDTKVASGNKFSISIRTGGKQ